jgi:hypothetical protein
MDCKLCGNKIEEEDTLDHHMASHISDPQYGIKTDGIVQALIQLDMRVRELEKLAKSHEHKLPSKKTA